MFAFFFSQHPAVNNEGPCPLHPPFSGFGSGKVEERKKKKKRAYAYADKKSRSKVKFDMRFSEVGRAISQRARDRGANAAANRADREKELSPIAGISSRRAGMDGNVRRVGGRVKEKGRGRRGWKLSGCESQNRRMKLLLLNRL